MTQAPLPTSDFGPYMIIRRNGTVIPFEPSMLEEAMRQALLAILGTSKAKNTQPTLPCLYAPLISRIHWRTLLWLQGLTQRLPHITAPRAQRRTSDGLSKVVGSGFFTPTKPNLRNAP